MKSDPCCRVSSAHRTLVTVSALLSYSARCPPDLREFLFGKNQDSTRPVFSRNDRCVTLCGPRNSQRGLVSDP